MKYSFLSLATIGALFFSACSDSSSSDNNANAQSEQPSVNTSNIVLTSATRDVKYLISESNEMSLYTFDKDTLGVSNCSNIQKETESESCLDRWPIYSTLDDSADGGDFATATPYAGHSMYKNHPLYYWFVDSKKGDVTGDNVGNVWHLIYPNSDFDATKVGTQLSDDVRTQSYLVSSTSLPLYTFDNDEAGVSNCNGECVEKWPIYNADVEALVLPEGVDKADFTQITRVDGSSQLAYKGDPLYHFFKDTGAETTNGDWVKGVWHLVELGSTAKAQ